MSIEDILQAGYSVFLGFTKKTLIDIIMNLREEYAKAQTEIEKLKDEKTKLEEERQQQTIKDVNSEANKPSSKKAEWEDKSGGTEHNKKKKKKKRRTKPKAGAGNAAKHRPPDRTETAPLE